MTEQYWKNIAYDTMPGGMVKFLADDPLTILKCNPKFCQMTGFTEHEMIQNGLLRYCDPLDVEFIHRAIRAQAKEQKSLHLEFRFKKWNGSLVWYQLTGNYIEMKKDCPVYVCSLFDVAASHLLQDRLRETQRALQAKQDEISELYHTVISGFAKVVADEWYTLLFANDRLFELIGYTRYQVQTMFNNEAGRFIHPRDLESFRMAVHSMNGRGRFSTKFRLLHRDGTFAWIRLDGTFVDKVHHGVSVLYCFYTDIDEQKEQETALQRQQYFTSLVTSSIAGGLTIFYNRPNWPIAYISESLLELLGYSDEEFHEKIQGRLRNIVYPEDLKRVEQEFALQCAEGSDGYELEFRVKKKNGSIIWVLEKGRQTTDENDEVLYVSMYMDITERKNHTDDLVHKSTHDSLTKLFNRAYTKQSIEAYLNAHGDKQSSALLLLDLDNFKQVNDAYGHMEGDRVLVSIGEMLRDTFLSKDIIGRMGGDEFLVFLKEIHSQDILRSKAQIICDAIKSLNPKKYKDLSASIGIAYISKQATTYEDLVQAADQAMYQAKFNGKNSWHLQCAHFDPERHDSLTGLCNYAYYQERVMAGLAPPLKTKYCLSYSDIKNFKYINDIYGYETGNRLLQFLSNTLSQIVPSGSTISRLASDRFSVFREYSDKETLETTFAEYVARLVSYRDAVTSQPLKIEIACGFYCIDTPSDIAPFHDMINRANIAQKSIKEMNGSRCAFYSKELRDQVIQEKEWELSLLNALEKQEFVVYLQPQVSIQNGTSIMGSEALVRWQRSDGILVPPLKFIPLFEKTGGILHLDYYVFEHVCRDLHKRIQEKKPIYQVSVNVSRVTMTDPLFAEKYCLLKAQYDIPDHILVLECTETAIIEDFTQFQTILKTLKSHGFLVAMDDFGTGYSSLNLLRNIDIDILKLDMGFFRGQENPLKSDAIISGVFNIAKALNLHTLAEGIESMTLVDTLRRYGCDSIQGYVYSKPRPMDEFDRVVTEIISETSKTSACKEETTETKTTD